MGSHLFTGDTMFGLTGLVGLFSDWAVRAALILLAVFGVAAFMRRAAAASRHVAWTTGLVSVLVVPILVVVLPWRLNVLPSLGRLEAASTSVTAPAPPEPVERESWSVQSLAAPIRPSETGTQSDQVETTAPAAASIPVQSSAAVGGAIRSFRPTVWQVVFAIWAVVAAAVTVRLLLGLLLAWRLTRRARPLDDPSWSQPLAWAAGRLGLKTPVRLLATHDLLIPVTTGVARPVIMLPESARSWSEERRRAVLLHELAHIKRWDWATQLMAHAVCALHWFNPLSWIAAKRLRAECERACDDLVLDAGTQASRYADHLLQIVRTAGRVRTPAGALPLAQRSEFEGRLLAILEPRMEQRRMKPLAAAFIAVIVLGLSLPLAAMAPRTDTQSVPSEVDATVEDDTNRSTEPEGTGLSLSVMRSSTEPPVRPGAPPAADLALSDRPVAIELEPDSQGRVSDRMTALMVALSDSDAEVRAAALRAIAQLMEGQEAAPDSIQVAALIRALRTDPEPEVRRMAAWALGELEDPRAVAALGEALLQDQDAKVRATAAWALGECGNAEAVGALGAALQDEDVEVRRMAIRALGEIESAEAVDVLIPALQDSDAEIRKYAAWALGEIEDARAVDALGGALRDSDPEVRRAAIHALGEIESPTAIDALLPALQDSEVEIRKHAAWALGEIEDARAVDALGRALGDESAEVRGAAVYALGEIESPSAVDYLLPVLQDSDAEVRKRAAWALGEIEDARAAEALGAALRDEDVEVRRAAIYALGEIESPMSVDALLPALRDSDAKIRRYAAWALGEIEDIRAADGLVAALSDDDAEVRRAVVHGLSELDLRQAPGPLMEALKDVDPKVREATAHALSHIGDARAVPALTAALQDTEVKVRRAALYALAEMPNEAAVNALLEALKDDDPQVRKAAAQALGKRD